MSESYVIIGDGIAGSSAAETIREAKPDADVAIITDEGEALYNRILIKEFAKGKLPEAPISIHEPEWYDERDIDLELNTFVTNIDADAHEVHTHDSGTFEYDKLLVATGGTPTQLPVDNSDADGIHHFWTFQDARAIAENAEQAETGVVVGAGLLGIDLAAICGEQDVDAHYIMRGNRWWRYGLSVDGAEIIHDALEEKGVTPVLESGVNGFKTDDDGNVVATLDADDNEYDSEFVGIAIGLNFNTEYLQGSGVETDNGVVVDQYMQTNVEDIYAAGDITRYYDVILDEYAQNGSWGSAKQQGAVAGKNMVADSDEEKEEFRWVSSYSITHFDFPFLSFGFPTMGDDECEEKYSDTEWRRLSFKDGKLIGGVLIGDIAPQGKYKDLIRNEVEVADQKDILLEKEFDPEKLALPQEQ
ncbi:Pyridine nucleotide-disulphide oxidoreductase [Haladaptatus litoreus]|uniref:Pyridine nucleotide-disulphide oxidoreductase n=1 Tax=Haladaptatus litoreus TaxID=553468 RepID=A0A1N6ZZV2_9EURY|nr:FAD-dependent oxidoreductase [Haladaptatus litoreus]SIR32342.1 Pyridine nucleotide-disulphide oxidoreductase [Haladaptatus litoreus]